MLMIEVREWQRWIQDARIFKMKPNEERKQKRKNNNNNKNKIKMKYDLDFYLNVWMGNNL